MSISDLDRRHLQRAISLARRGEGHVEPNPMVGCVIAAADQVLGEGWHLAFGGPHAEIVALESLLPGTTDLRQATLYVSLEPCCHQGKTPPCTEAIIRSGIPRVVVALQDPYTEVSGKGIATLRAAGIDVQLADDPRPGAELVRPYLKRLRTETPWVIAKWAMTLDGKIATRTGDSRWISCQQSRQIVHQLRGRMDAIIIGAGTARIDDPMLTARPSGPRVATRVVVDRQARLSLDSQLVTTIGCAPVLIAASTARTREAAAEQRLAALQASGCEVWRWDDDPATCELTQLLKELGRRQFTNVLVEGGSELLGSFLDRQLIDEVHMFLSPILVGGSEAVTAVGGQGAARIAEALQLESLEVEQVGDDIYLHGMCGSRL